MQTTIALRCDATAAMGVGHVARCMSLAEELRERGVLPVFVGEVTVPWLRAELMRREFAVVEAPSSASQLAELAVSLDARAVVLDGYDLDPGTGALLRASGIAVLSFLDGSFGAGQDADLYLDQNLGAERRTDLDPRRALLGLSYACFRDEVLRLRDRRPADARADASAGAKGAAAVRVLTVFGGTDAHQAARDVVPLVLETGAPVHVVAVSADPEAAARLRGLRTSVGQTIEVLPPQPDLPGLAASCDLAVTASGSSVWEFLCLGVPMAVLCVVDNQLEGYERLVGESVAEPLGRLGTLRSSAAARETAVATLRRLLTDGQLRHSLGERGRQLVDGNGRARVVDALLAVAARQDRNGPTRHTASWRPSDSRSH